MNSSWSPEQSGLIGELTEYVLDTALAQARTWKDEGRDLGIAVNLSAPTLSFALSLRTVLDLLHELTPLD